MQDCDPLKLINLVQKINGLYHPTDEWFQAALQLSGMKDLYNTDYVMMNHMILNEFIER